MGDVVLTQVSSLVHDANLMWMDKMGGSYKLSGTFFNDFRLI
jgi:hypothetical protein